MTRKEKTNTTIPKKKHLTSDLVAGLTFALVNINQAMAHALLAAVNPVFGLYTLMLAGLSPGLRDQLQRTGMLNLIGEENIFLATETIGEAGNAALRAAKVWLRESAPEQDITGQLKDTEEQFSE